MNTPDTSSAPTLSALPPGPRVLVWLRRDLRLDDNALFDTLSNGAALPVYCFDPAQFAPDAYIGQPKTGPHRAAFLWQTVQDLRRRLQAIGSDLYVAHGAPADVLPDLARRFGATHLRYQRENTPEEQATEAAVEAAVKARGVRILPPVDGLTLFRLEDLPFPLHRFPLGFSKFRHEAEARTPVLPPLPAPSALPPYPTALGNGGALPTLLTLGDFSPEAVAVDPRTAHPFRGGEAAALARLHDYVWGRRLVQTYKQTRNGLVGEAFSSKLSAWLAIGALSPRRVWHEVTRFEAEFGRTDDTYWLRFELLWRDFFQFVARRVGPDLFRRAGLRGQAPRFTKPNPQGLQRWTEGRTGAPFVDAAMRELHLTGWTSNRMRQNVASYLINTQLVDWRLGAAWFESRLVDYDPASNWGNWQYLAGTGTDAREGRAFDINQQARAYDPRGEYQRYWAASVK